ncbi:MAG: hypothetical protein P4N59_25260, partial [Negativicutes bacterium]|nr:hypothetical protein [Negativicutes bacterium]
PAQAWATWGAAHGTVAAAGTPVALGAMVFTSGAVVMANPGNTAGKYVYIFPTTGGTKAAGILLAPGAAANIPCTNANQITIDADTNGDGVIYWGANG